RLCRGWVAAGHARGVWDHGVSVTQRRFEIGIRMAFGAEKGSILRTVLGHAALLAGWGIALGLVLSLALARMITSMLIGVSPLDPASLGIASVALLIAA